MKNLKKKSTALLTLLIFAGSIFLPNAAALATSGTAAGGTTTASDSTTSKVTTYTAYDNTPDLKTAAGLVDGMKELRVKDGTSTTGTLAYALNMSREMPAAAGTDGYVKLAATTNVQWLTLVDKASDSANLRQNVLNVIWNGYPYFSGSWKGVDTDFASIGSKSGLSDTAVTTLNNIAVTQQAIWALTDSREGAGNTQTYVNELIAAAQKNPAPANFSLDVYDGAAATVASAAATAKSSTSAAKAAVSTAAQSSNAKAGSSTSEESSSAKKMSNLVAVPSEKPTTVSVTVNHSWLDESGKALSDVKTPSVSFVLYAEGSTQPLATYSLADGANSLSFSLVDDEQSYSLVPVLSGDTDGFTAGDAQTISLKGDQGDTLALNYSTTYKKTVPATELDPVSVDLDATVTVNGSTPLNGAFTVQLKDESGNIVQSKKNKGKNVTFDTLSFNKEGTYKYTMSMKSGSSTYTIDSSVYTAKIDVTKGDGKYVATVSYTKNGSSYSGTPAFTCSKTTKATSTTTSKSGTTKTTTPTTTSSSSKTSTDRSTPQTGDESNLNLLGTVALIALSGMVAIAALWLINSRRMRGRK